MSTKQQKPDTIAKRVEKLNKLLRYHRQQVFGPSGEHHHRALLRLKRTATFKRMADDNAAQADYRRGEAYARMGY